MSINHPGHYPEGFSEAELAEKDGVSARYLRYWQQEVKQRQDQKQNGVQKGLGNIGLEPEQELLNDQVRSANDYFRNNIVKVRQKQKLPPIIAHGTTFDALFGAAARSMDQTRKGLVAEGMSSSGDFGNFERSGLPGGQGGWWQNVHTREGRLSSDIWLLKCGPKDPSFTIVFPDPRTYQLYLQKMQQHLDQGHPVTPHRAMMLAEWVDYLSKHQGRMPGEVN